MDRGQVAQETEEVIDAVRRGQDVGRTVRAAIIDERTGADARSPDDNHHHAARLLPHLGMRNRIGRTREAGEGDVRMVIEGLSRLCKARLRSTEVPEAVEKCIYMEG